MGRERRSYEREGEGKDEIIRSTSTYDQLQQQQQQQQHNATNTMILQQIRFIRSNLYTIEMRGRWGRVKVKGYC